MRIIAITAQKGGSGKTTNALNLGTGLSYLGKKVLLIDMDPQASLTDGLGVIPEECKRSVADVLLRKLTIPDVAVKINRNLDLVPASDELTGLEISLADHKDRNIRLSAALDRVKAQYDYIIIDCAQGLGLFTVNALIAATEVFIPTQLEYFSMRGIGRTIKTVNLVKKTYNQALQISGIITCMYMGGNKSAREMLDEIRNGYGSLVFTTVTRRGVAVSDAAAAGKDIFAYSNRSNAALDYTDLCNEIIDQEEN